MQDMPIHNIDKIDRAILRVLQKDGRVSNVQLADRVGLSESACLRRVRLLEQSGIIDRYVMLINQAAIGKPGNVFVRVTLEGQQKEKLQQFEKTIAAVPEVMECYLMSMTNLPACLGCCASSLRSPYARCAKQPNWHWIID